MDVRGESEMTIGLSFSLDVPLAELLKEGGVEEFAKRARELLEKEIEPLRAIEAMKKITDAVTQDAQEPPPIDRPRRGREIMPKDNAVVNGESA